MASKEVMGKINKLIDEAFFVKDNREQDSVIKDIDFFKSRISHSRLINEIDKDINVLYATGKFDDLSNIRNILYLNLNKWILSYNTASSIMKDEYKKMLDIKSHAIKTVLDIINSLLDLERYPVTLSNESIKRLKEQHEQNKKEIINSIPNLFQFIEYLHANINHFNDWAEWIPIFTGEQTKIDESDEEFYKSNVENHSSKLTTGKIRILTRIWLIIPFRRKVRDLDIADLDRKQYNFIHNKYNQAATALIYKVKEDKSYISKIHKIYGLYFGFKRKIDPRFTRLYPLLFATLDNVIKSMRSIRYVQAGRLIPEVEFVEFERKDDKLKNSISEEFQPMSIETKSDDANVVVVETPNDSNTKITPQTKSLFSFIDFLHANIDNFNQYDEVILKKNIALMKLYQLGSHFTDKRKKKDFQKKINAKWDVIFTNIVDPIEDKVAELALFDWHAPETLSNNHMPLVLKLSEDCDDQDVEVILKAKRQYIEFTNKTKHNVIEQAVRVFRYLNEVMLVIAKDFEEEGDMPIKFREARKVETFYELVEGFKAGERVYFSLFPSIPASAGLDSSTKLPCHDTIYLINDNTLEIDYEKITTTLIRYRDNPKTMKTLCKNLCGLANSEFNILEEDFYRNFFEFTTEKKEQLRDQHETIRTLRPGSMLAIKEQLDDYEAIELLEQIINELRFEENKQETESLIALNNNTVFPESVKNLFYLVEFISANITHFKKYNNTFKELDQIEFEKKQLGPIENYQDKVREIEIEKRAEEKRVDIFLNVTGPIKTKAESLDIITNSKLDIVWLSSLKGIEELKENPPIEDVWLIKTFKEKYLSYKKEINTHSFFSLFFKDLDKTLMYLFSFFRDKEEKEKPFKPTQGTEIENQKDTDNTMDINYEGIFQVALTYADDPTEMREFCIREQKKAEREYEYIDKSFYKGLLKVVADKKEMAKYQSPPGPTPTHIGSFFIAGGGGSRYKKEDVELLEQIINELRNEDKTQQAELASTQKVKKNNVTQNSHVPEAVKSLKLTEKRPKNRNKVLKERTINGALLSQYFKNSFHGMGENPINYFSMLVEDLESNRTGKEFGEIALMIYNSKHVNDRMPREFNKWFVIFCECIDIKKPTYKKGVLKDPSYNLKQLFNYL